MVRPVVLFIRRHEIETLLSHVVYKHFSLLEEERKEDAKLENISAVPVLCRVQETFDLVNKENYMLNIGKLSAKIFKMSNIFMKII